jgi:hypothetical protein
MMYPDAMDSGAMIYIPSFIKIGPVIQKVIGGYTDTQTAWGWQEPTFIFSKKGK